MVPEQGVLTVSSIWARLEQYAQQHRHEHLADMFEADKERFQHFSQSDCGLLVDYSKQRLNTDILSLLVQLADERHLGHWIECLFSGQRVNCTEQRSAMHWRLREPSTTGASPEVHDQLDAMGAMVDRILTGQWRGSQGDVITDVVNVGVGGSELGPLMAAAALHSSMPATGKRPRLHFASSMDGSQISQILHDLDPRTTPPKAPQHAAHRIQQLCSSFLNAHGSSENEQFHLLNLRACLVRETALMFFLHHV